MGRTPERTVWDRAAVLGLWSLFVWGNRLNNLRSDGTEGVDLVVSLGLSLVSVAFAVAVLVRWVQGRRAGWTAPIGAWRGVLQAFCGWTVAVWVVRGADIVLDWRSVGFVVVHLVLAGVSIALAVRVWRSLDGTAAPSSVPADRVAG